MGVEIETLLMDRLIPAIERINRTQFIVPNSGGKKPLGPFVPNASQSGGVASATYGGDPDLIKWAYGLSGKAELALNGNRYALESGDLAFVPQNTPHQQRVFERRQNFQVLWFTCCTQTNRIQIFTTSYQGGNQIQVINGAIIEKRQDLARWFERTVEEVQTRTRGWCSYLRANVNEALLGAMRHLEQHGNGLTKAENQRGMVDLAKAYIQSRYAKPITLKEISREVYLSPNYFSMLFAKATGMTVFDYVQKVRLDEARRLLAETNLPVRDIARQTGYSTAAHFTRSFGQRVGCSPRKYRNAGEKVKT
jgi:AraC-like DNA-binding protein